MLAMAFLRTVQGVMTNRWQASSYRFSGISLCRSRLAAGGVPTMASFRFVKGLEQVLRQGLQTPGGAGSGGVSERQVLLEKQRDGGDCSNSSSRRATLLAGQQLRGRHLRTKV